MRFRWVKNVKDVNCLISKSVFPQIEGFKVCSLKFVPEKKELWN